MRAPKTKILIFLLFFFLYNLEFSFDVIIWRTLIILRPCPPLHYLTMANLDVNLANFTVFGMYKKGEENYKRITRSLSRL